MNTADAMGQNYGYPKPAQQAVIAKLERRVAQLELALSETRVDRVQQIAVEAQTHLLHATEEALAEVATERDELRAEVARLKARLDKVRTDVNTILWSGFSCVTCANRIRAALAGEVEEPE